MITLENESDLHKKDVETLFFFFCLLLVGSYTFATKNCSILQREA